MGYFTCCLIGTMASAIFSESVARIRKYPAISYLIISVLPLIPGSSIYYTALEAVKGNMDGFVYYGIETLGTADTPDAQNLRRRIGILFARSQGTMN
jgi:uncharacterized membrane protein YjjB (DUF3815 family)